VRQKYPGETQFIAAVEKQVDARQDPDSFSQPADRETGDVSSLVANSQQPRASLHSEYDRLDQTHGPVTHIGSWHPDHLA
jgi:hypothetical protein